MKALFLMASFLMTSNVFAEGGHEPEVVNYRQPKVLIDSFKLKVNNYRSDKASLFLKMDLVCGYKAPKWSLNFDVAKYGTYVSCGNENMTFNANENGEFIIPEFKYLESGNKNHYKFKFSLVHKNGESAMEWDQKASENYSVDELKDAIAKNNGISFSLYNIQPIERNSILRAMKEKVILHSGANKVEIQKDSIKKLRDVYVDLFDEQGRHVISKTFMGSGDTFKQTYLITDKEAGPNPKLKMALAINLNEEEKSKTGIPYGDIFLTDSDSSFEDLERLLGN